MKENICRILHRLTLEDLLLYGLSLPLHPIRENGQDNKDFKISESQGNINLTFNLFREFRDRNCIKFLRLSITLRLFKAKTLKSSKGLGTYKIETKLNIKPHKDSPKYINILKNTVTSPKGREYNDENIMNRHLERRQDQKISHFYGTLIDILSLWKKEITKYKRLHALT